MDNTLSVKLQTAIASAVYRPQPSMSGNVLSRLTSPQKRAVEDATTAILEVLRTVKSHDPNHLSACPFCSGSASAKTTDSSPEQHYIECDDCGVQSTKTDHNGTAQQLWEQRSARNVSLKNPDIHSDEVISNVKDFIYWVANNDFEDPECIFVCAEWFILCGSVNLVNKMAGEDYRKRING